MRCHCFQVVQRRINLMEAEGINFETCVKVGDTVAAKELLDKHDMLLLCMGSAWARDLPIPGKINTTCSFCVWVQPGPETFLFQVR